MALNADWKVLDICVDADVKVYRHDINYSTTLILSSAHWLYTMATVWRKYDEVSYTGSTLIYEGNTLGYESFWK